LAERRQRAADKPTRLLLIRHGETAWNAEHRIQGQLDIPLSARGVWQANRLATRLAQEPIDALLVSDLARATLTARPLGDALGLEPTLEPRLRERSFGIFEGFTVEQIATRWPEAFVAWRGRDPAWAMDDGESGQQFIERVLAALADAVQAHGGKTVALVAHGGTLDVAYRASQRLAWDAPRKHMMINAAINRMHARVKPLELELVEWGDIAHLADDAAPRDDSHA
jgi:probable phosphoglycerate mutase